MTNNTDEYQTSVNALGAMGKFLLPYGLRNSMEVEQAQSALNIITVGVGILWIIGTWYVARAARVGKVSCLPEPQPVLVHDVTVPRAVVGTDDIEGPPAENQAQAVRALATGVGHHLGNVRIAEEAPGYVRFEGARGVKGSRGSGLSLGQGELWFSLQTGHTTHVDYAVEVTAGGPLISLARIVNVLGLIAIVIGYLAISKWIIPSPFAETRAQVFQMLQTIHFLWPPFLLAGLYQYQHAAVAGAVETFVHNLPYLSETRDGAS